MTDETMSERTDDPELGGGDPPHDALAELLGAYADGELPDGPRGRLEAHLVECAACRRRLATQRAVGARLAGEPAPAVPAALRARILAGVAAPPAPAAGTVPAPPVAPAPRAAGAPRAWGRAWVTWSGWAVAAGLSGVLLVRAPGARTAPAEAPAPRAGAPVHPVPMVAAAVADYRRVSAAPLPGGAGDLATVRAELPFPVEPLHSPDLRLLGAWTTRLRGEPAAALAYRWRDQVVVQYVVPERLFFRQPDVRRAVANGGVYAAASGAQGVVAWPLAAGGALLVGDAAPAILARLQL